jgi:hypothetical protein
MEMFHFLQNFNTVSNAQMISAIILNRILASVTMEEFFISFMIIGFI